MQAFMLLWVHRMTKKTFPALGARIKALRLANGLTQSELAERCGYEPLTVSRFERGTYAPGIEALEVIADVLGVSLQDFFVAADVNKLAVETLRHQISDLIYATDDAKALADVLKTTRKRVAN